MVSGILRALIPWLWIPSLVHTATVPTGAAAQLRYACVALLIAALTLGWLRFAWVLCGRRIWQWLALASPWYAGTLTMWRANGLFPRTVDPAAAQRRPFPASAAVACILVGSIYDLLVLSAAPWRHAGAARQAYLDALLVQAVWTALLASAVAVRRGWRGAPRRLLTLAALCCPISLGWVLVYLLY